MDTTLKQSPKQTPNGHDKKKKKIRVQYFKHIKINVKIDNEQKSGLLTVLCRAISEFEKS